MKYIKQSVLIILASLMTLSGCVTLNKYSMDSYDIDLTQFDKQGLLVTTGDCFQKYKSVSILSVKCLHGYVPKKDYKKKNSQKNVTEDDIYSSSTSNPGQDNPNNFDFKQCELADLFSEIIDQAKQRGANGIIKLEIEDITTISDDLKVIHLGFKISGLAIDIESSDGAAYSLE